MTHTNAPGVPACLGAAVAGSWDTEAMTNDTVLNTWAERELPVLRAALRRLDAGEDFPMLEEIRAEVGLDVAQMRAGLRALEDATPPYIDVSYTMAGPDHVGGHVNGVSERARRELGSWPSATAVVDQLVAALSAAADDEPEPQRKSRLRAAADALTGFAREIAVQAIGAQLGRL
jgi:hypothetical protein